MGMGNGKVEGEERETKRVIEKERNGKEKRKEDRERNSKRE